MKLALLLCLVLPMCMASKPSFHLLIPKMDLSQETEDCQGYFDFLGKVAESADQCEEPDFVPTEGCELREQLAEGADWYQCIFSPESIGWMEADEDSLIWSRIKSDLEEMQIDDELDGLAEACEQLTLDISEDEIEVVTMELFGLDPSTAGEQEACWEDGVAIDEVRVAAGIACPLSKIQEIFIDQCI